MMFKYGFLLIFLALAGFAECISEWQNVQNNCKFYNPCSTENETVEWYGACEDGKANGPGILKWYENSKLISIGINTLHQGKFSEKDQQIEIWDDAVYVGYENETSLKNGVLLRHSPVESVYIGSFNDNNPNKGIMIFPEKLIVSGGRFNVQNSVDGDGFMAFLAERTVAYGLFRNGKPEEAVKAEFHKSTTKDLCDIAVSFINADSRKHTSVYKGICGFRTELPDYTLVTHDKKIWLSDKKGQPENFFLMVEDGLILHGQIKESGLEGLGVKITENTIETGTFRHGKLVDGWSIRKSTDLESIVYDRVAP